MPVPGGEFEAEMLGRAEMPGIGAKQTDDQEDRADQHMEAVEPGRHEEGRAIDIAGERERGVGVFVGLHAGKGRAEQNGEDQAVFQALAIVFQQRVMRPGDGGAGGQQQQRVQQWQMPGIEGLDALWGPDAAEQRLPGGMNRIGGKQRRVEEGPEPGDKEHHFGGDEQDHAIAMADLHHAGVIALVLRLADHIRPPARHGVEHADAADAKDDRRRRKQMVHPGDRADRHDERRNGADDRPRARINEVVVVMLDLRRSHFGLSPLAMPVRHVFV